MKFLAIACGFSLLGWTPLSAESVTDGAALFTANCAACHLSDQAMVGPSLVEIRGLYLKKPDDFVKWCVAPGKKRQGAIEMPSMIHVGEPGLRAIHAHMMAISEGVVARKQVVADPFPATSARPLVQRIFLPDASPAAIAVALDENVSLCWDAGPCRLRYVWTGGFIDGYPYWKGNGSSLANISGAVRYSEAAPLFKGEPKFKGYQIRDGLPVFLYAVGQQEITETFAATAEGVTRTITLSPAPGAPLVLELATGPKWTIISDVGTLRGNQLTLTPQQATRFTLTHRFR